MASSDNLRIAKNTLLLYGRMIFLTLINLYTVRITLNVLGIEDYGIYTVVGSFVALFGVITSTLTSATQRFLAFNLGEKNYEAYSRTFSLLVVSFLVLALIIVLIAEIAGLFAFESLLKVPEDRMDAAKWVYQTSLITFIIYLIIIPYTASIVANEKMSAFAYISIIDGILRLGLVYLLTIINFDRLILYGILTLAEAIVISALYMSYCHVKFEYCKFKILYDKTLFKELSSYTGWNLLGALSGTLTTQGQSILLNVFFGPVVNAAKGVADKIYNVIYSLSSNFYMAVSPQIVKTYAAKDYDRMRNLTIKSSKFSFFLLFIVSFPAMACMDSILTLWLGEDGKSVDMAGFSRLVLIQGMLNSLEVPITQMIRATGKIKEYQIKVGVFTLMYIPLAWIALKLGGSALTSMWVLIALYAFVLFIRLRQAHKQVDLSIKYYLKKVILPIMIVVSVSSLSYFLLLNNLRFDKIWDSILIIGGSCFLISLLIIGIFGLDKSEYSIVRKIVISKLHF